jgi:N-methylhydantoinase A
MGYRIGIDVGGTFTDFILIRPSGELVLSKVPTMARNESAGIMNGIAVLARKEGLLPGVLLGKTDLIVHGTTIADNTMIEMNGALTGLITTEGHRDQIEIRRGYKEEIWDPAYPPPVPIAKRRRRIGVPERLDFKGEVVVPLDEAAARAAVRRLAIQDVESIAVSFLFSHVNPAHELRMRRIIEEEHPRARVSLSHEVMPSAPEFERTSTTLVDAYVGPRVERYLALLEAALEEAGYAGELLIMQSNGGVMTADFLKKRAICVLGSGPTGGVMGACAVARQAPEGPAASPPREDHRFIAVDMGGTSYEVSVLQGGRPSIKSAWNWYQRYLVGLPMVEMHAIGAGGGSIARVEAGALKVGPESSGAEPGPICYGRGGKEPTVTDANVVLGYLNPRALCGGEFELKTDGVREALRSRIGRPLGLDEVEAAHGVFRIVNANMANAIRRVTSKSGLDPREFEMIVYGGNGPVHAGKQAEDLGIRRMIIPKTSPAFSALGLLIADYIVHAQRAYIRPAKRAKIQEIDLLFEEMAGAAENELALARVARADLSFSRFLCMSYPGQTFDMAVPASASEDGRMSEADLARTIEAFHDLHEAQHAYAARQEEPILRAVRLETSGKTEEVRLRIEEKASTTAESALVGRRPAYFDGRFLETPIYDGERLGFGHAVGGPAIIEQRFTTIVLSPGHSAQIDPFGSCVVTIS